MDGALRFHDTTRAALLTAFILEIIFLGWIAGHIVLFPYGINYGEAPLVDQAIRLANGLPLYKADLNAPPFVIANYPPVYPALLALNQQITGLGPFQAGRLISLAAALISALMLGLLTYRVTGRVFWAILSSMLFLAHPDVLTWASIARVDSLALALSLVALYLVFTRWMSWRWLLLAMLCLLGAIFTRQTYLLAAPTVSFYWLWRKDRRRALAFAALLVLGCGALFAGFNWGTHGGFYLNIVRANVNAYELWRLLGMTAQTIATGPVLLSLTVLGILLHIEHIRKAVPLQPSGEAETLEFLRYGILPYTVVASLAALTAGKVGSDTNYFLEFIAACTLWGATSLTWFPVKRAVQRLLPALLVGQVLAYNVYDWKLNTAEVAPKWAQLAGYHRLYSEVSQAVPYGQVLSDDRLDMIVLAGQSIYYQPFEYRQLHLAGVWDASRLATAAHDQQFSLVVIGSGTLDRADYWPPDVAAAIRASYESQAMLGGYQIFHPNWRDYANRGKYAH